MAESGKKTKKIKKHLEAGCITVAKVGSFLGSHKINMVKFCNEFNEATKNFDKEDIIPTLIEIEENKNFTVSVSSPTVSHLIKKKLNIEKGSSTPGREFIKEISKEVIIEIAKIKINDLNIYKKDDIESMCKTITASAASMGIKVV